MKTCVDCMEAKPFDQFWRDSSRVDGLNRRCRSCAGKQHRGSRSYRLGRGRKDIYMFSRYGLTIEQHAEMLGDQDGKCAICGEAKRLVIDHCHASGVVRELLCNRCNVGLGYLEDAEFAEKATLYIHKHRAAKQLG